MMMWNYFILLMYNLFSYLYDEIILHFYTKLVHSQDVIYSTKDSMTPINLK